MEEFLAQTSIKLIQAAGGLLWDDSRQLRLIAVVHRIRYDDCTLPKGKLNEGESWEKAALREVEEETGYRGKVVGFAGAIGYQTDKGDKLVRFWNMEPMGMNQTAIDQTEVKEVVWLSPAQACEKLSYPLERALVESWADPRISK
jgi:ADP-ribose pyrophosphatase YjhB (NUDIX family)